MPSFVPLGIADYSGNSERGFVQFTYQIADNNAKELTLQIRDGSSVIYEEKITDANKLKQGEHIWKWDGFDSGGILDTAKLTQYENLNLYTIGVDNSNNYSRKKLDFSMRYDEVKWVDVKIDKNSKRIDVTLRVNLKDGGARGIECKEIIHRDHLNPGMRTSKKVCPWDKIPEEYVEEYGDPLKERTKTYRDLEEMALDGINIYWSRRYTNTYGTIVNDENWEVIVTARQNEKGMKAPELVYFTNSKNYFYTRSHNWEASRKLYYKTGFLKYKDWSFLEDSEAEFEFKVTSAHEIGHEILKAYGGHIYSKQHKGSSYMLPQEVKPVKKESFIEENIYLDYMENYKGENYPNEGEIDLMKYYNGYFYSSFYDRIVASKEDVLSLIWLTKIKLK